MQTSVPPDAANSKMHNGLPQQDNDDQRVK
jgi:hypothetical protein